jgi:GDP-L-fucose synthase
MPTNQYGINDNFNLETSHVLPAMIRKFHDAKISAARTVVLWGTGEVYREFMYSDDLASACLYLMENKEAKEIGELVNIGSGEDLKIKDLAELIKRTVGFKGEIVWDKTKPDGTPKKLLDISRLKALGWEPKVPLEEGIGRAYGWYVNRNP